MWQSEMVRITRVLINDLDSSNYTYTDSRIQEVILVAAQLVITDVGFKQTYTIDVDQDTLTPDPTNNEKDDAFINLVCLRTACIFDMGKLREAGTNAVKVKDGEYTIDTTVIASVQEKMIKYGACTLYQEAKLDHLIGNNVPGEAILGPLKSPNFLYYGGESSRDRTYFN